MNKAFTPPLFRKTRRFILPLFNKVRGFTVSELLVVIAIIGILSLLIIPSYKNAKEQLALERSAVQLAQYIAKAREMAISTQKCAPCGDIFPSGGYGIYLKRVPATPPQNTYILFADTFGNDQRYNQIQDVKIEEITLESNVIISGLSSNHIHIGFEAPDPTVSLSGKINDEISDPDGEGTPYSSIDITIALASDSTKEKTIRVNKMGLISID